MRAVIDSLAFFGVNGDRRQARGAQLAQQVIFVVAVCLGEIVEVELVDGDLDGAAGLFEAIAVDRDEQRRDSADDDEGKGQPPHGQQMHARGLALRGDVAFGGDSSERYSLESFSATSFNFCAARSRACAATSIDVCATRSPCLLAARAK